MAAPPSNPDPPAPPDESGNPTTLPLRTLIGVAAGTTALLTAVVVAVAIIGQPLDVGEQSIRALAAWSAYASAVATVLLVVGAFIAALQVARQIEQAATLHKKQLESIQSAHKAELGELKLSREASLRPVVQLKNVEVAGDNLQFELRNVGPGPALKLCVRSFAIVQTSAENQDDFRRRVGIAAPEKLTDDDIHYRLDLLASRETEENCYLTGDDALVGMMSGASGYLYYQLTYCDVFNNPFADPQEREPLLWEPFSVPL